MIILDENVLKGFSYNYSYYSYDHISLLFMSYGKM